MLRSLEVNSEIPSAVLLKHTRLIVLCLLIAASIVGCKSKNDDVQGDIDRLRSLGYMGGYRPPQKDDSQVPTQESKMQPGYTLVTTGHAPAAYLLNAQEKIVHTWEMPFEKLFPDFKVQPEHEKIELPGFWRHATLLPNGELLVIFEGLALAKLDRDSHVLWAKQNGAHHDLEVQPDGGVLVLTRTAEVRDDKAILLDYLSYLKSDGTEEKKISLLNLLLNSEEGRKILGKKLLRGDVLHSNSVQTLSPAALAHFPAAKPGDVLVSFRNISSLAIIRPSTGEVVWGFRGDFRRQHYARIAPDGASLVLFDNMGAGKHTSRVLRYSWPEMKLLESIGSTALHAKEFTSRSLGVVQPLENGNLLITESEGGHVFELDGARTIIWKYTSPYRTGDGNRLIATVPHAIRVPLAAVDSWLQKPEASAKGK